MYSISFESPDTGAIGFSLKMSLRVFLGYYFSKQRTLMVKLVRVTFLTDIAVYCGLIGMLEINNNFISYDLWMFDTMKKIMNFYKKIQLKYM